MMIMILPLIIITILCGEIWPSVAQITIVVEPSPPAQQISQSIYLVGLEGKHFLYNDVTVNARYVRDLADEHVHAIVISLLSKQRKSFTIPIQIFMVDNAIITVNFEKGITKTQIFWNNTDHVNSNIESGQDRRDQIKAYLTEKYRKCKQQRNEVVALMLKTAIKNEAKMEVEEEKEEGEI